MLHLPWETRGIIAQKQIHCRDLGDTATERARLACLSASLSGDYSASTWCTVATAIDPSPTADATRFVLPLRTSPTASTPGRLVSRRCGGRRNGQRAHSRFSGVSDAPVLMNPLSSNARHPASDFVFDNPPDRISMCTRLAVSARNTAAWPAELAPPTIATSSSVHICRSMWVAA